MITVKDVVSYNINKCSKEIRDIKCKWFYVRTLTEREVELANRKYCKAIVFTKTIRFINPKCLDWSRYIGLKRECTKWLKVMEYIKLKEDFLMRSAPIEVVKCDNFEKYELIIYNIDQKIIRNHYDYISKWKENKVIRE